MKHEINLIKILFLIVLLHTTHVCFFAITATFLFITGILWWPRGAIVKFENKN